MSIPSHRRSRGFTLVELLVVIAIIAVLASAGFAAGRAAIDRAKRMAALQVCTSLELAVNQFHTEYGILPKELDDDPSTPIDTKTDLELLNVLVGLNETKNPPLNARGVKFLNVKEGKGRKNGLIFSSSGSSVMGLFDPWGGPYYVMMDGNYDEKIKVKPAAATADTTLNGKLVAVWSNGADCVNGVGGKATDDVKTW